jgi:hypothetical protein
MSGAMLPLRHTGRQQELHLYTAVCIDMRKNCSARWIGYGFKVQRRHCASISSALVRVSPRPPMVDDRVMNLIKAISQRWQHVIARGNKIVEIRDDL